jgi:putative intracellular protease/amidase
MRKIEAFALILSLLFCCNSLAQTKQQKGKILMIVNEDQSADLELMLTKEVGVMKDLLQKAGFQVVVATASKRPLEAGYLKLQPDLKLSDVRVSDYKGFIMPCMATNIGPPLSPEGSAIVKEAAAKGKPIAAQTGSVFQLSQAGVLKGKKYALPKDHLGSPPLADAVYSGDGVVQDDNIITSGVCPYMAKMAGMQDGTSKLTEALIAELLKR